MRLSSETQKIIRETAHEIFGEHATVLLFGSRVDDAVRGGDIDLLVQVDKANPENQQKALRLVARLQIRLGDQPIDVLVIDPETVQQPVHKAALRMGVKI